jgi:hypothetical protein
VTREKMCTETWGRLEEIHWQEHSKNVVFLVGSSTAAPGGEFDIRASHVNKAPRLTRNAPRATRASPAWYQCAQRRTCQRVSVELEELVAFFERFGSSCLDIYTHKPSAFYLPAISREKIS